MGQSVALDQWRGVALLLVLVSHGFYFTDRVHGVGRVGVNLFFFISGLLVYRSLARSPDGGAFWWRRAKRICPALAAFVVVMLPVTVLFNEVSGYREALPAALLFSIDYWPAVPPRSLGHLWSIACEMQFYALAPVIFLLGNRARLGLLFVFVVAGMAAPVLDPDGLRKYHFEYAAWPLMLGFSCEQWKGSLARIPRAALLSRAALVVFGGSLGLMAFGIETKTAVIAGGTLILVPCLLGYLADEAIPGALGRLLAWLGQRTYSIYLWQQPLTICNYLPVALQPLGAAASTLVGALSFRWFEQPFLSSRRQRKVLSDPLRSPDAVGVGL